MLICATFIPYVYKITNLETGEFYIGSRCKNVKLHLSPEEDLLIYYFSSGTLKDDAKQCPYKYMGGVLFRYSDENVVFWYEQILIRDNIVHPLCKNKTYLDPDTNTKAFNCPIRPTVTIKTRRLQSLARLGKIPWNKGRTGLPTPNFTPEWRNKISIAKRGKQQSPEHIEKLAARRRGRRGRIVSPANRQKKSIATAGIPKALVLCPHCGKIGGNGSMQRWHFDNCKENNEFT